MRIVTNWQYGHWVAADDDSYDGPGSPLGIGPTEAEAIADLNEQLAERQERAELLKGAK